MPIQLPESLLTGIPGIDDQHRALIHWAQTIKKINGHNGNRALVVRAANFLIAYTKYHFDSEEYAMVASGYDGIAQHRKEHAMMKRQLAALREKINAGDVFGGASIKDIQNLIQNWIQNHIVSTDSAFATYCEQVPETRFVELPSPKELKAMGFKISDYEEVEAVHHAGEITPEELQARMKKD